MAAATATSGLRQAGCHLLNRAACSCRHQHIACCSALTKVPGFARWESSCAPSCAPSCSPCKPLKTTYEGSCEDFLGFQCGGLERSAFVKEVKCSELDLKKHFTLIKELGEGATATVHLAVKNRTGEEVALKIIEKARLKDAQMLRNEIAIHKATDHPNILRLLEVWEDECNLYLATELCQGGDLWRHLTSNSDEYSTLAISEEQTLQWALQIVNSVLYLHKLNVVHRDLKPSNFLRATSDVGGSSSGILKLADFGVSAHCSEHHRLTRKVGTDGFIAPEILKSQPYNEKADIFSIGCILHMMLTGHPPKPKPCGDYTISKIRLRFVSQDLRELVEAMLSPEPSKRPSAQEILESPVFTRVRDQGWKDSMRLGTRILDNMYAYSSFPLLKKAALVAMVSRAESDAAFTDCIRKFMSLDSSTSALKTKDLYRALEVEMVQDMQAQVQQILRPPRGRGRRARACAAWLERQPRTIVDPAKAQQGLELFKKTLYTISEELVARIDVASDNEVSYSEWLAATADASWYTESSRIKAVFNLFDYDGDGVITREDLEKVIPHVCQKLDVNEVLLESQHRLSKRGAAGIHTEDFFILIQTHKPSKYTLQRIRSGLEDPLLP